MQLHLLFMYLVQTGVMKEYKKGLRALFIGRTNTLTHPYTAGGIMMPYSAVVLRIIMGTQQHQSVNTMANILLAKLRSWTNREDVVCRDLRTATNMDK